MLIDSKNYIARNGNLVFNVFNRKTVTNENVCLYFFEWLQANKDCNISKKDIVSELSSSVKFPFVGTYYNKQRKKWIVTNWTITGKFDTIESPFDLIRLQG